MIISLYDQVQNKKPLSLNVKYIFICKGPQYLYTFLYLSLINNKQKQETHTQPQHLKFE